MTLTSEQIKIALSLPNPYDYGEFLAHCRQQGLPLIPMRQYTDEINRILPNKKPGGILSYSAPVQTQTQQPPRSSCCGGGKIR